MKNERMKELGRIQEEYEEDSPQFLEETFRFCISDELAEMLLNSKTPKSMQLVKFPFNSIFLDCKLETKDYIIPNGIYLLDDGAEIEEDMLNTMYIYFSIQSKETGEVEYIILAGEPYMFNNIKDGWWIETLVNKESLKREIDGEIDARLDYDTIQDFKDLNKRIDVKGLLSFIANYCLFLNDPRVTKIVHQGRKKEFKQKEYHFYEPKTVSVLVNDEIKRYVDQFKAKSQGVKFMYHYKFIVRGHFKTLLNNKYKRDENGKPRIIWITPFFRGSGEFIKKRYNLENIPKKRKWYAIWENLQKNKWR